MNSLCVKLLEKYVRNAIRANSPIYYELYKCSKGYYLDCKGPSIYDEDGWSGKYEHSFQIYLPKREIVKALRLLNEAKAWKLDSNCLPEEFSEFEQIKALSVRKQEGISPFGKKISSWMVLTQQEDEYGLYYSPPYSNCFKSQEQAFRRANEFMQLIQHVNSKVEVIFESPVNSNDFWRNQNQARFDAYEQANKTGEGTPSVQAPQNVLETPS